MRTLQIRSLSLAALALLLLAGNAAAQDTSPALLSTLEVQQLITHGKPNDHARLSAHYEALAERHVGEAKRHAAMAQAYRGTRITGAAVHCDHLVALSRDLATEAAGAAAMHKRLAGVAK